MTTNTTYPIPTLPVARAHALALMFQPMVSLAELAAIVETDPGAAAAILRAANSVASSPVDRISRIGEAIVRVGVDDTRSILVALLLHDTSGAALERSGLDLDELWRHLIATALLTEAVCAAGVTLAPVRTMAFTAGILHDVGRLVLAATHPRRYERVVRLAASGIDVRAAEVDQFGVDHAAFGAGVARAWSLPEPIVQAIGAHHDGGDPLSDALRAARGLGGALGIGNGIGPPPPVTFDIRTPESAPVMRAGGPDVLHRRIEWFRGALRA